MHKKPVAIVLGGTNPHIALVQSLKIRGYHTVLIDYFENPPAKRLADEHIRESTLDMDKVLEIATYYKASLVISTCLDQANVTACFVSEKLGLPVPYSYETALDVTNKILMKTKMLENGIPTAKCIFTKNFLIPSIPLKYPLVIKPADSNGSKGVKKITQKSELEKCLIDAMNISRTRSAIIEEFCEGIDVDVVCYIQNGKANILLLRQRYKVKDDSTSVMQYYRSLIPADISTGAKREIQRIADNIARAFNLDNTPMQIQVIVKDSIVNVIEFAPRVGGGLSFRTVKLKTSFDILESAIDSYTKKHTPLNIKRSNYLYSENNLYARAGVFGRIDGFEELRRDNIVIESYCYKSYGSDIGQDLTSNNRIGAFIVRANNRRSLFQKVETAIKRLEVYDVEDKPILRRDIYNSIAN